MKLDANQFKGLYNNLVDIIPENRRGKVCVFFPRAGSNYFDIKERILFIGKSVNGWITNELNVDLLFDPNNPARIVNIDGKLFWQENNKQSYNINRSAFCRFLIKIASRYLKKKDWRDDIAWTNLYKISPWEGGNPSASLRKLQEKICVEILQKEIEYFNPKFVIFLTSHLEDFYLKHIGYDRKNGKTLKWGDYETNYQKINGRTFILSPHPQGKKEAPHAEAIISIMQSV